MSSFMLFSICATYCTLSIFLGARSRFSCANPHIPTKGLSETDSPFAYLLLIHDPIQLHQLDALAGQLEGTGRAVVRAEPFSGVVDNALHPRHG